MFLISLLFSISVFAKVGPLKQLPHSSPQNVTEALANYNQTKENVEIMNKLSENTSSEFDRKFSECERRLSDMDKLIMGHQHDFIELKRHFEIKRTKVTQCSKEFSKMADEKYQLVREYISLVNQSLDAHRVYLEWKHKDTSHLDTSP